MIQYRAARESKRHREDARKSFCSREMITAFYVQNIQWTGLNTSP